MRILPPTASVVLASKGAQLHAPSAERNTPALLELLVKHAPRTGRALELASGTGQHVTAFAPAFPDLLWQPTEIDAQRRASIDAYVDAAGLTNVHPARSLDATVAGWAATEAPQDLIMLVNLLHLITRHEADTLIAEAGQALGPGGTLILYGPFLREGQYASDADGRFDAQLREANSSIGYKDRQDISEALAKAGLCVQIVDMPANNLAFVATKEETTCL